VPRIADARLLGDIREMKFPVIPIECITRDVIQVRPLQRRTIEKIYVNIPVIVIIEQREPRRDVLHDIAPTTATSRVPKRDPRPRRDIGELDGTLTVRGHDREHQRQQQCAQAGPAPLASVEVFGVSHGQFSSKANVGIFS